MELIMERSSKWIKEHDISAKLQESHQDLFIFKSFFIVRFFL